MSKAATLGTTARTTSLSETLSHKSVVEKQRSVFGCV